MNHEPDWIFLIAALDKECDSVWGWFRITHGEFGSNPLEFLRNVYSSVGPECVLVQALDIFEDGPKTPKEVRDAYPDIPIKLWYEDTEFLKHLVVLKS